MKILLYADPHFSSKSSVIRGKGKKYSTRLENLIETFNWINKLAIEKNCEEIICLGDLFDSPDLTAEEITAIAECDISHHRFIVGNHDSSTNDLSINSINTLQNSRIYTNITYLDFNGYKIIIVPYMTETSRIPLNTIIEPYKNDNFIILSHNDLKDVQYGSMVSKTGYEPYDIPENCDLFINGHIHNGGWVTDKVLNLGSLTGINFNNDASKWKNCVAILDLEEGKLDFVLNPHSFLFYKKDYSNIKSIKHIENFINSLDKNMKNIVSIKVNNELLNDVQTMLKNTTHIYYSRVVVDYGNQQTSVEIKNTNIDSNINYFDKFKKFIDERYSNDRTVNYSMLMEEIDNLVGVF